MGNNRVPVGQRLCYKVIIRNLEEGTYRCRFIPLRGRPRTNHAKRRQDGGIRFDKEAGTPVRRPISKFIRASLQLVAYFFDTKDLLVRVLGDQPIPEIGEPAGHGTP